VSVQRKAPVALFAYNRPVHLRRTVEALLSNPEAQVSELFIFSDGAKDSVNAPAVAEVRRYINQVSGFATVRHIQRETNFGLSRSIVDGVSRICSEYGRVIVVEDDLVTSSHFLRYMNEGLTLYEQEERVISIHGYVYPTKAELPETFLLLGADCWGWATWKRGWDLYENDGRVLLHGLRDRNLLHRFDFDGAYPYVRMLKEQIAGKNDSWAVRWHASAFLKEKLTLYPGRSLVHNIGADGSGSHRLDSEIFAGLVTDRPIAIEPIPVEENSYARHKVIEFFRDNRPSMAARLARRVATLVVRKSHSM
jgi:glycosyltransferase involved in cell wall biosynthesis